MANSIILSPFVVRLRVKRSRTLLTLDDLPTGEGFQELLSEYLEDRRIESHVDEEAEVALKVERHSTSAGTTSGILKSGEYGYEAELEDIETGETKTRGKNDCEYIPFFFRLDLRPGQDEGILILQRFGVHGVKTVFRSDFQEFMDEKGEDFTLDINPLVTQQAIEEAMGGGIKKIRFIKNNVPSDVAEDLALDDNVEAEGEMELIIKTRRDHLFGITDWMRQIVNGQVALSDLLEIHEIVYDDIKLQVNINGRNKTLALSNLENRFRASFDVTDEIVFGADGHPTLQSLRACANALMPDLRAAIGWG